LWLPLLVMGCGAAVNGESLAQDSVLFAAGDIGVCGTQGAAATAALLKTQNGPILALGDLAYPAGSSKNFQDCFEPTWGALKSRLLPAPGNHEYRTAGARGYFDYFGTQAGPPGLGYYSVDFGAWHLISLNSNVAADADSAQMRWLREDLRSTPAVCVLAFWHHPRFSSGLHGANDNMAIAWATLYAFGATLVLAGHDHDYERFAPRGAAGEYDEQQGMRSFVVGTGGAPLYSFTWRRKNSQAWQATQRGVLKLTLRPHAYDWAFLPVTASEFRDEGSGRCVARH
jgi:hypothetical protein